MNVEILYEKYGSMVLRRCRRLLRDEDRAMDAMQDVFVRVLQRRDRLKATYPSSLLYRIATNVCLNRIRDQRLDLPGDEVLMHIAGMEDPESRLDESLFSYARLRNAMDRMEAEVQIAILDACASGAITRLKGGRRQKAFMVDASSDMRGYAFLTSSSGDEAAQESDAIGASFFSHYLVSGLRGAADVTGDGRVTLNEAYQFAFQNTLEGTERTQGGAQHPAYDIKMWKRLLK